MARIPTGNFGQSVASPQRQQRVFSESAGVTQGESIARLGQQVQGVALDQMAAQTRLDQEVAAREAQTNAARVRISKINELDEAQELLGQDILAGRVRKEDAENEWAARSQKLLQDATTGLDQRYAGAVQLELDSRVQRGSSGVRKAVTVKNQEDTRANLMTLREEYQRLATKDRDTALAEYFAQLDAMAPAAGMGADDIAKQKQSFREDTAYTQATSLVGGARDLASVRRAREALAGDGFADLDPQRRAQIEATLEGRETTLLQRQKIAAQRAARQQEARMREAAAAYETGQSLIDRGIALSDDETARLAAATAGTPYAEGLRRLQQQAREVGGFAAQPVAAQQAALDQVNAQIAQQGASEALVRRRDQLQKILDGSRQDLTQDPLRAGLQRGVIESIEPIDVSSVQGLSATIGRRLQQANVVQQWAGRSRPVSPLTTEEAEAVGQMLNSLPVQQRATAVATLGTQLGPQAAAGLAAQLDGKDKAMALALQFGASKTTAGRHTSELILKGQAAIRDKVVKVDAAAESGWRAQIAEAVGDAYTNERQAADVREAAYLITAGLAAEGNVDPKRAVRLAARGDIVDFNGKKVPVPAGMSRGDLEDRVRSLTPDALKSQAADGQVVVGGQRMPLETFVQALPDAQLISAGSGRYVVSTGGRVVTNTRGAPITITAKP